jgi:hypothetical protein
VSIQQLLQSLSFAESRQHRIQIIRTLGALRASEAAAPLVHHLVKLHRSEASPYRDESSPGHELAVALVNALRQIGRPGLAPFVEALAMWDRYALDLTGSFVAVHGEEGVLVLDHRARNEADAERSERLRAALWFTQLQAPQEEPEPPPLSTPRTR